MARLTPAQELVPSNNAMTATASSLRSSSLPVTATKPSTWSRTAKGTKSTGNEKHQRYTTRLQEGRWKASTETLLRIFGPGFSSDRFLGNLVKLMDLEPSIRAAGTLVEAYRDRRLDGEYDEHQAKPKKPELMPIDVEHAIESLGGQISKTQPKKKVTQSVEHETDAVPGGSSPSNKRKRKARVSQAAVTQSKRARRHTANDPDVYTSRAPVAVMISRKTSRRIPASSPLHAGRRALTDDLTDEDQPQTPPHAVDLAERLFGRDTDDSIFSAPPEESSMSIEIHRRAPPLELNDRSSMAFDSSWQVDLSHGTLSGINRKHRHRSSRIELNDDDPHVFQSDNADRELLDSLEDSQQQTSPSPSASEEMHDVEQSTFLLPTPGEDGPAQPPRRPPPSQVDGAAIDPQLQSDVDLARQQSARPRVATGKPSPNSATKFARSTKPVHRATYTSGNSKLLSPAEMDYLLRAIKPPQGVICPHVEMQGASTTEIRRPKGVNITEDSLVAQPVLANGSWRLVFLGRDEFLQNHDDDARFDFEPFEILLKETCPEQAVDVRSERPQRFDIDTDGFLTLEFALQCFTNVQEAASPCFFAWPYVFSHIVGAGSSQFFPELTRSIAGLGSHSDTGAQGQPPLQDRPLHGIERQKGFTSVRVNLEDAQATLAAQKPMFQSLADQLDDEISTLTDRVRDLTDLFTFHDSLIARLPSSIKPTPPASNSDSVLLHFVPVGNAAATPSKPPSTLPAYETLSPFLSAVSALSAEKSKVTSDISALTTQLEGIQRGLIALDSASTQLEEMAHRFEKIVEEEMRSYAEDADGASQRRRQIAEEADLATRQAAREKEEIEQKREENRRREEEIRRLQEELRREEDANRKKMEDAERKKGEAREAEAEARERKERLEKFRQEFGGGKDKGSPARKRGKAGA